MECTKPNCANENICARFYLMPPCNGQLLLTHAGRIIYFVNNFINKIL